MPSDKNNASIFFLGINDMQMEKGSMNAMGMMLILVCRWNNILRWYLCYPSVKPNKNVWNSCHIREPDTFTWDTAKVTVEYCCRIPSHKSSTCEEMYMSDHILIREMYQIAPWYCPTRIKSDNHRKPL